MTWLSEQIAKSVVLVIAKETCENCDKVLEYCRKSGFTEGELAFHQVGIRKDGEEILAELHKLTNKKDCPTLWVRGNLVGGVEEAREAWFQGFLPKAKYDMILEAAARDVVAERATSNTLVVFSKKTCPPCVEIKIMLQEAGFTKEQTNVVTISDWPTMDKIQEHFVEITGERWTPRVWINGKAMGGMREIKPMYESEDLHALAESLENQSGPVKL